MENVISSSTVLPARTLLNTSSIFRMTSSGNPDRVRLADDFVFFQSIDPTDSPVDKGVTKFIVIAENTVGVLFTRRRYFHWPEPVRLCVSQLFVPVRHVLFKSSLGADSFDCIPVRSATSSISDISGFSTCAASLRRHLESCQYSIFNKRTVTNNWMLISRH